MFFFSSRRRHTRYWRDWSSDVCSSDLGVLEARTAEALRAVDLADLLALALGHQVDVPLLHPAQARALVALGPGGAEVARSEERRVGQERRCRWSPHH